MRPVVVIDTGSANTRSVVTALRRVGLEPTPATGAKQLREAHRVVLPGVGAFGAAMNALREQELTAALRERCRDQRPTLAVCVGLQILARSSEESPGVDGLGVLPVQIGRFRGDLRVPHMGWNRVKAPADAAWIADGHAYFANSYRIADAEVATLESAGWELAMTDYERPFVAAVRRGSLLGCQFHPELSGEWGSKLLRTWADSDRNQEVASC